MVDYDVNFVQFLSNPIKGGLADKAGMEEQDVIILANGTNTETLGHKETVAVIQRDMNPVRLTVINRKLYQTFKRLLIDPADGDLIRELRQFKLKTEPSVSVPPPSYSPPTHEFNPSEKLTVN